MPFRNARNSGLKPAGAAALATIEDSHVVAAYARWAPIYDRVFGLYTRAVTRIAVAEINRLPPGRVLEIGVGTGIALPFYEPKHKVVGIDLSPDMLARASRKVASRQLAHVEGLHEMDAGKLAFPEASFDTAVAMFVITVVPDPQRVLGEMIRVVKPGGRVILLSHFSVETGIRARLETVVARYSAKIGFRPNYRVAEVLGRPELRLIERRELRGIDRFTLLVFERLPTGDS
jgi:phosphatidylethanolamine/phosphatidyl-N-methylethanolamine N-methyltransferase